MSPEALRLRSLSIPKDSVERETKHQAFALALTELQHLGVPEILPQLKKVDVGIKRHILGGSHSVVTYPPLNALEAVKKPENIEPTFGEKTNLYIHLPFCETQCTFCHYDVSLYRGADQSSKTQVDGVTRYLNALYKEMEMWGRKLEASGTKVSSIYIGGGTPLVLEKGQLSDLLNKIRTEFDILSDAEICVEGSPLTITAKGGKEKLHALRENGVTRFSFGIQSFDDEVLKRAGRGHKGDIPIEACKIVDSVFENWNLDLIQGLYKGTPDEVYNNLQVLEKIRPPHITWYHGRFANRPQRAWLESETKGEDFETEIETLAGRMLIWQRLQTQGYDQIDGNRFVREERFEDPFKKTRTSVSNDLLGIGSSAYSHTENGLFLRNLTSKNGYIDRIEKGQLATGEAMTITPEEYLAASYAIGLRTGRVENASDVLTKKTLPKLADHYSELEIKLLNLGLLENFTERSGKGLRLSRLGTLFEDEILSLFYSPTVLKKLTK